MAAIQKIKGPGSTQFERRMLKALLLKSLVLINVTTGKSVLKGDAIALLLSLVQALTLIDEGDKEEFEAVTFVDDGEKMKEKDPAQGSSGTQIGNGIKAKE